MGKYMLWLMVFLGIATVWVNNLAAVEVYLEQGTPLNWTKIEELQPASAVLKDEGREGYWKLRIKDWNRPLLNGSKGLPDLTLDPKLQGYYKIYVLYRCVTWDTSFGLKLSSEKDFQIIKPEIGIDKHWDDEVLWKNVVKMDGEKITLRALSNSVYFYGFRFVSVVQQKVGLNVGEHVVIMKEDGKHFAFPGVAKAKNGDLLVVAREGLTHGDLGKEFGVIAMARSKDQGRTWEKRVTIAEVPKTDLRDPSIICLSDGTILVTSTDGVRRSSDNGYTWEGPFSVPVFSPHGLAEGSDGNVYYVGLQVKGEIYFTNIVRSKDKGKTWELFSTVFLSRGYAPPLDCFTEPSLFISGNRWIVTHRYEIEPPDKGYVYQSFSNDSGNGWTFPRKTSMWGHPADVVELPDKRLLCVYGYRRPPFGVRAAVSSDRGETWDIAHEIVVRDDGGGSSLVQNFDLGYPKSVILDDGRVFSVYYFNTKGTNCFITGSFYALPKIQ